MHDDRELVEARIRRQLRERVIPAQWTPGVPLEVEALHVPGEPIPAHEARAGQYEPFDVGGRWGPPWSTTWFRMRGEVPGDWTGRRVEAIVDLGGSAGPGFTAEALVWGPDGPVQGLHPDHKSVLVVTDAAGGEPVELEIEAAANPDFSTSFRPNPMGDRSTAPEHPLYRLARAELAARNDTVWHLVLDVRTLVRLMVQLPTNEPRRHQILRALEQAFDTLDLTDVPGSAADARVELAGVLSRPAHASAHRLSAVGHAHIDTAWLWPLRETKRKCARTFSNQLALMDEYPEHVFVCSQAQQYQWMKDEYPELWDRMRRRIDEGRFVPVGSMWVEADTNIPSGESLVRQFVHGKRFFAEELDIDTTEVWIPDVFGYSGQLPQIMALAGCRWFLTQKLSWNDTNRFPHHTFWWEGIDGTRIFTHFPSAETYNGSFHADELARAVHGFSEHGFATRSFYPFGHGDGGGGPTREMLELARRQADLEGSPRVTIEPPEQFFAQAHDEYPGAPVWRGELYFEMHRGTYTSQARTKWGNRRGEHLLREAELWSALAARETGVSYPAEELDRWWKVLLLHQFHDIIPGSSIAWVHRDTEDDHERLHAAVDRLVDEALERLAAPVGGVVLANAAGADRSEVVVVDEELAPPGEGRLVAVPADGATTPVQHLADGRLVFHASVPGSGLAAVRLEDGHADPFDVVVVSDRSLENELVSVRIDDAGRLASVFDKSAGREVLREPGNVLQLFDDHPNMYDAWDVDAVFERTGVDLLAVESIDVAESGPVLGAVRITRSFGRSHVTQMVSLRSGSPRVDVETEIDWHEDEKLLKVAFPLAVRADEASYEIQFGHVHRPTHGNTSWDAARFEVCGQRWADVSEAGYGVALLNDAKYGHDCHDDVLRLTLLRAPNFPDPGADRGHHRFRYALFPHVGSLQEAGVPAEAEAFNLPVRAAAGRGSGGTPSPAVRVGHPAVALDAVKLADDGTGDLVVRCHESFGGHARARIVVPGARRVVVTDLLERGDDELAVEAGAVEVEFRPFQILTLRCSNQQPGSTP